MKKYLLSQNGEFYKASLHTHSTVSDGQYTPEQVKEKYKALGYSVLCLTDHSVFVPHNDLTDDNFIMINGWEAGFDPEIKERTWEKFSYMKLCHMNAYAEDENTTKMVMFDPRYLNERQKELKLDYDGEVKRVYSPEIINDFVKQCHENGFLVSYNHPQWSNENYLDYSKYKGFDLFEIYNHGTAVCDGQNETDIVAYDDTLRLGVRSFASATDDAHTDVHMGGGFDMIKTDDFSYKGIIKAIKNGDFYASQGPEFKEISFENNVIHVETSAIRQIRFSTASRRGWAMKWNNNEPFYGADFEVQPFDGYVRIEITGVDGTLAWSRAFFVDELPMIKK